MSEELYELLKQKDAEIAGLRAVIEELLSEFASLYAADEHEAAWDKAHTTLSDAYYRHGFKTDGRFRG